MTPARPLSRTIRGRTRAAGALVPLPVLLLPLLLAVPAPARADRGIEITPYAGFTFGGSFDDNTAGGSLDVEPGESFGLILDLSASGETQYELFYGYQRTELTGGGTFGGNPLFDLDIHYLHLGGTYLFPEERVRPYIAGGLGATILVPDGEGLGSKAYFSLSLGGGVKIPLSGRIGLRFEGRGFLTILPESTEIFCVSSGGAACRVSVQGDLLGQVLLLGGISFSP